MTRATVSGLPTAHPLAEMLPAVYVDVDVDVDVDGYPAPPPRPDGGPEGPFVTRYTAGLDEVLAPVFLTLDCLDAYLDSRTAPVDLLDWLAGWLGVDADETWSEQQRRVVVATAVELHGRRGTKREMIDYLRVTTGLEIEIEESGGAAWSPEPGAPPPGDDTPRLVIRLPAGGPYDVEVLTRLHRALSRVRPAHLVHEIVETY